MHPHVHSDDVVHHIYKLIEMCAVSKYNALLEPYTRHNINMVFFCTIVGMAGSSEYFLNSSGYVYGYIGNSPQ